MSQDTEPAATVVGQPSATRRVRARLARRITAQRAAPVKQVLEPLAAVHRDLHPKADLALLQHAYDVAEEKHRPQRRKSGDPYITHPLAVATILAELGMDTTTLVAALLHDTVEDTDYSLGQLKDDFGEEVARLVDGVTKLDKVKLGAAAEAETIRKMVIAMAKDPRVLVIKLADRLHNMRTMRFLPPEKQARKARETLEVLAPLAHRLGMATVKWELEDLAFAILQPKKYDEIVRLVAKRAPSRDTYLRTVVQEMNTQLEAARIVAKVEGRPKHYYSINQKMIVRGRDFDDIHDLVGVRILVDEVRDCYAAMGVVHAAWQPMPGRFKDYIAQPRFGVYQSLHTTVIGPDGKPLEVQIRTQEMHQRAEYGIAAHWRYKETKGALNGKSVEIDEMAWMRQLLDWQREAADPGEFLEGLRWDLAAREIFVFTPKGDVQTLPTGSCPVDFAYAVHTEVGHRCIGARVNGRLVALERKLENGEVVEIFTSKAEGAGPSRDWLSFVASPRAKAKIKQWFAKERKEEAIEQGKDAITKEVRRVGLPIQRLVSADSMQALAKELHYPDMSALYAAVGRGSHLGSPRRAAPGRPAGRRRTRRGRARRPRHPVHGHPAPPHRRRGRDREGRGRRVGETRPLLHPGAGRRHPRLRDAGRRRVRPPHRLHERRRAPQVARAAAGRRVGAVGVERVPRGHPGGGVGSAPAALGRHEGAGRRTREHPVGVGDDVAGPGGGVALLVRDGRPEAPRARAEGRTERGGRLRRLPRHLGLVTASKGP